MRFIYVYIIHNTYICMYRLGYTESTLLFFYYLDNFHNGEIDKSIYIHSQYNLFKWLCTTSGFYDKNIDINNIYSILNSNVYNTYFNKLLNAIKEYTGEVTFYFNDFNCGLNKFFDLFFIYINKEYDLIHRNHNKYIGRKCVYNFINNKRVVIINNTGCLMKEQYYNGNLRNIYDDLPPVINIDYIEPSYTFFNDGPYNSILESIEDIYKKIDLLIDSNDAFIISCGAYSVLIADYIFKKYNKEILIIGGDLPTFFGVNTKRGYMHWKDILENNKQYFIDIPNEMKPKNYQYIEDGCYW